MVGANNRSTEQLNMVTCPKNNNNKEITTVFTVKQLTKGTTQTCTVKDIVGN